MQLYDPLILKNFDILPQETILENNDKNIVIKMKYKNISEMPTMEFGRAFGYDKYILEFLYFQWFDEKSSSSLPIELHAIFRNSKIETLEIALDSGIKKDVLVFVFGLQVIKNIIFPDYSPD